MPRRVAVTGASGFLGRRLVTRLVQDGRRVSALLRRPDPALAALGVEAVAGSLTEPASLATLVQGADALIHVAGAIRAKGPAEFHAVNAAGTAALAEALLARPELSRLLHVSSLAARAPQVSAYAASKRAAEDELARRSPPLRHVVVRPPAIYGPGDRATLPIFAQLSRGWLVAPRAASNRFSLVHVDDLVELLVTLLDTDLPAGTVLEPDDGTPGGYGWADLARIAAGQLGRPVRLVALPASALRLAAGASELIARWGDRPAALGRGKVEELLHADWVADTRSLAEVDWRPRLRFSAGFAPTLAWYKQSGWLP